MPHSYYVSNPIFTYDFFQTILPESLLPEVFFSEHRDQRQLLTVEQATDYPTIQRLDIQTLTGGVHLLGSNKERFLRLVQDVCHLPSDQMNNLSSGNFDAVPLPTMLQVLQLDQGVSFRAQAKNPTGDSSEVDYIIDVVNFFHYGAITGVPPKATLEKVLFTLLGRKGVQRTGNTRHLKDVIRSSHLRGVSGSSEYHAQEHSNETMWKVLFLLLDKRDVFDSALGGEIDETIEVGGEEGGEEEPEMPPVLDLPDDLEALGWVVKVCADTGRGFYYNKHTHAWDWDMPDEGQGAVVGAQGVA